MRLLLDSHALLWWLADDPRLPESARSAIADGTTAVAVSAATTWEISIKAALGKLTAPDDLLDQLSASRFEALDITVADGMAAGRLPRHLDDPFDRMLVAQAMARDLTIVTVDPRFADYEVDMLPSPRRRRATARRRES